MNNNLMVFNSNEFGALEIYFDHEGKEWFPATDVAKILGYKNPRDAVLNHCKKDGVVKRDIIDSINRKQKTSFINEGNLYRLIIKSKLPGADRFETWVFEEVLPSLRKRGVYIMEHADDKVIDKEKLFGKRRIKNTFSNAKPSELNDLYHDLLDYTKDQYTPRERVYMLQSVYNGLSELNIKLADDVLNNIGKCYDISILQSRILHDKAELQNRINGGIKSFKTKTINKLNPPLEEFMVFNIHPISENYMYEAINHGTTNEAIMVRTNAYSNWLYNFPKYEAMGKSDLGINWNNPLKVFIRVDCLEKFDISNFTKAILDMVITRLYKEDDKIVVDTNIKLNRIVETYKDGKIYVCIKNI